MHVLRQWRAALVGQTVSWLTFQQSEACFDVDVRRVEIRRSSVGVQCITCLVVTRFVQGTQVVPHLRDVRVETNCTRIRVQRVSVLIDLVVENTDRAPKRRIATIAVDCLLICFIGFGILLLGHVTSAEQIPTLSIILV